MSMIINERLPDGRIPAKEISYTDQQGNTIVKELQFIGAGTSAMVYRLENPPYDQIIKEFYPLIPILNDQFVYERQPIISGTREAEDVSQSLRTKPQSVQNEYADRRRAFFACVNDGIVQSVYKEYKSRNGNLFVVLGDPKEVSTLGPVLVCNDWAGRTLQQYLTYQRIQNQSNRLEYVKAVLDVTMRLLKDLSVLHRAGYVNMDIKDENVYCINDEDDQTRPAAIRNLDYGSILEIRDTEDRINTQLAGFFHRNDEVYRNIAAEHFASSPYYYSEALQCRAVEQCSRLRENDNDATRRSADWALLRMDLVAVLKTCLEALATWQEYAYKPSARASLDDREFFEECLRYIFMEAGGITSALLSDYFLYYGLRALASTLLSSDLPADCKPVDMAAYVCNYFGDILYALTDDHLKLYIDGDSERIEKRRTFRALCKSYERCNGYAVGYEYRWQDENTLCGEGSEQGTVCTIETFRSLLCYMKRMYDLEQRYQPYGRAPASSPLFAPGVLLRDYLMLDPIRGMALANNEIN